MAIWTNSSLGLLFAESFPRGFFIIIQPMRTNERLLRHVGSAGCLILLRYFPKCLHYSVSHCVYANICNTFCHSNVLMFTRIKNRRINSKIRKLSAFSFYITIFAYSGQFTVSQIQTGVLGYIIILAREIY